MYVMNRKRKAERYAEAMKRYRSRLLHIGVTQWIEVATDIAHVLCVYEDLYSLVCHQHASSESGLRTATPNTGTVHTPHNILQKSVSVVYYSGHSECAAVCEKMCSEVAGLCQEEEDKPTVGACHHKN